MIKRKMTSNRSGWNYSRKIKEDVERYEDEYLNGREMTKNEVIEYLFGSYNEYPSTSLDLYLLSPQEKTVKHRLNMLWVMPITLLVAPYSYIRYGSVGWTNKTKVGKFILECVGEDK